MVINRRYVQSICGRGLGGGWRSFLIEALWHNQVAILRLSSPSSGGFPSDSAVKNPPAMQDMQEMWVRSLGGEDP